MTNVFGVCVCTMLVGQLVSIDTAYPTLIAPWRGPKRLVTQLSLVAANPDWTIITLSDLFLQHLTF